MRVVDPTLPRYGTDLIAMVDYTLVTLSKFSSSPTIAVTGFRLRHYHA